MVDYVENFVAGVERIGFYCCGSGDVVAEAVPDFERLTMTQSSKSHRTNSEASDAFAASNMDAATRAVLVFIDMLLKEFGLLRKVNKNNQNLQNLMPSGLSVCFAAI